LRLWEALVGAPVLISILRLEEKVEQPLIQSACCQQKMPKERNDLISSIYEHYTLESNN